MFMENKFNKNIIYRSAEGGAGGGDNNASTPSPKEQIDTQQLSNKTPDYVTKSDLEAMLSKFALQQNSNTKPEAQEDKSDVVNSILQSKLKAEAEKELERKVQTAYANKEKVNTLADRLGKYSPNGKDFYKKVIEGHEAKNYSNEMDRVNYTASDIVANFFANPEFTKYLVTTDKGVDLEFTNLSPTDKKSKACDYLGVIERTLQRMDDIEGSKAKSFNRDNINITNSMFKNRYLAIRKDVDYYEKQKNNI